MISSYHMSEALTSTQNAQRKLVEIERPTPHLEFKEDLWCHLIQVCS